MEEKYITRKDLMRLLRVSRSTVIRWEKAGRLTPIKVGRKVWYRESEIEKLLGGGGKSMSTTVALEVDVAKELGYEPYFEESRWVVFDVSRHFGVDVYELGELSRQEFNNAVPVEQFSPTKLQKLSDAHREKLTTLIRAALEKGYKM